MVQSAGKYGFIDSRGRLVVPPTLHAASDFSDGVAVVMPTAGSGEIIDPSGKTLAKLPLYKSVQPFSEGLAVVMRDENHWGFMNVSGQLAIAAQFRAAMEFSEGLAAAADSSGRWGWIDRTGHFVVPPQFDGGGGFREGLARFGLGNKSGYVDRTGKVIVEATFFTALDFSEGLGLVWDGTSKRFLDKTGTVAIEVPPGATADSFHGGLAAFNAGDNHAFMDPSGKAVLKPRYDWVSSFSEGLAPVRVGGKDDGKWGSIDKSGKLIIAPQFSVKPVFKNGLAKIKTPQGFGYIDRTGAWVWKPSK